MPREVAYASQDAVQIYVYQGRDMIRMTGRHQSIRDTSWPHDINLDEAEDLVERLGWQLATSWTWQPDRQARELHAYKAALEAPGRGQGKAEADAYIRAHPEIYDKNSPEYKARKIRGR